MDRYELLGDSRDAVIPGSDKELIRYGYDIERLSEAVAIQGGAPTGTAGIEFAYLRDRVASIPATSLAGAAVKLRGLIAGRPRGLRLGDSEMALLRNVLEVIDGAASGRSATVVEPVAEAAQPPTDAEPPFEGLVSQFMALAARHRALVAHNLSLRKGAGSSVASTQALRRSLESLSIALDASAAEDSISEAKFLALFGYWDSRRGGRAMPARADIDPLELTDLWPNLGLWRVEAGVDLRCHLCGTHVSSLVQEDLSGKLIAEARNGFWGEQRLVLEKVAKSGRLALLAGSVENGQVAYRALTLPLSSDGRTVDMLLTATVFRNARGDVERPYFTRAQAQG